MLNYYLFEERIESDRGGWEKAEAYGFSLENPITIEWVMEHPKEAVEIVQATANEGDDFDDYQWIKSKYDKITGEMEEYNIKMKEEPTEQE